LHHNFQFCLFHFLIVDMLIHGPFELHVIWNKAPSLKCIHFFNNHVVKNDASNQNIAHNFLCHYQLGIWTMTNWFHNTPKQCSTSFLTTSSTWKKCLCFFLRNSWMVYTKEAHRAYIQSISKWYFE
jgi:hypothetical protein